MKRGDFTPSSSLLLLLPRPLFICTRCHINQYHYLINRQRLIPIYSTTLVRRPGFQPSSSHHHQPLPSPNYLMCILSTFMRLQVSSFSSSSHYLSPPGMVFLYPPRISQYHIVKRSCTSPSLSPSPLPHHANPGPLPLSYSSPPLPGLPPLTRITSHRLRQWPPFSSSTVRGHRMANGATPAGVSCHTS